MRTHARYNQFLVPVIGSERIVDVRRLRDVGGAVAQTGDAERCIRVTGADTLDSVEHPFVVGGDVINCNVDTLVTSQDIAFRRAVLA